MKLTVARADMSLSLLLWEALGRHDDALLRAVLAANPGLASAGAVLPVGLEILVPEIDAATKVATVKLWD